MLRMYVGSCCSKKIARQTQAVLKRQHSESRRDHQESISVLIRCLSQRMISLTEASIRISRVS